MLSDEEEALLAECVDDFFLNRGASRADFDEMLHARVERIVTQCVQAAASEGMENVDLMVYGSWRGLAESLRTLGTEETYEAARQHWERIASDAARAALREAAVRPYPEGTKLVVVSEGAWEEARLAECTIPELQDALANADGYAKGLPDRVADFLLGYSGDGDESDPQSWQSGHNYAMREAARMIRERWFDLPKPELPTPEDFGGAQC